MKKIFQIVYKGVNTNKIELLNYNDYLSYKGALNALKECEYLHLITTNIYYE